MPSFSSFNIYGDLKKKKPSVIIDITEVVRSRWERSQRTQLLGFLEVWESSFPSLLTQWWLLEEAEPETGPRDSGGDSKWCKAPGVRGRLPGAVLILVTPQLAPKTLGFLSSRPVRGQLAEPVPGCVGILTMLRALGSGCYLKLSAFFQSISFLSFFFLYFIFLSLY